MRPNAFRRFRVRRIGIVEDEREALGAIRHIAEVKRRRDISALASIFRRDLVARLESGRGQGNGHRSVRIGHEQGSHGEQDQRNELPARQAKSLQSFSLI
jgi:hypothetical protein